MMSGQPELRTTPATEDELDLLRHYRETGKLPAWPKWYQRIVRERAFPVRIKFDYRMRLPRMGTGEFGYYFINAN